MTSYGDELPAGWQLCGGQYTIDRYLNSGGFGITYAARDSLGRRVVIKECFPGALCCRADTQVRPRSRSSEAEFDAILELFEKEATALAGLRHPYIVGVHQFFRDNGTAYMAMDLVEGQTLLDLIENDPDRLTPDAVKKLLLEILEAVGYIHSNDILHRDISPDNILIDSDNLPVLIDFGAARQDATRVSRALSKILTVKDGYSPQEFYLTGSDQDYSSDLYALAATFYHVVSRTAPPSSHNRMAAAARDLPDPLVLLEPGQGYDDHFIGAINACLSIFPKDRLGSAAEWRNSIDLERRQQALLDEAEQDEALEARIARLVAEFRTEFEAAGGAAKAQMAAAKPKPEKAAPAKDAPQMSDLARALSSPDLIGDDERSDDDMPSAAPAPKTRVMPRRPRPTAAVRSDAPAETPRPVSRALDDTVRPRAGARADQPLRIPTSNSAPTTSDTEAKP
ncbi:protein kinase [Gymnodinialimonas sp. 2305UL16-5]|uniref:serine/threonine protein kinase n=1 Tax=Gymnodinialimonas mytili TaxID=3126503 RepID=UPI0030A156CE